ncbi:DUF423 domain-containing protein [Candidatus Nitrospira neomarina]|uniref:DUF423 domain-containing protein n=1 Tax=Candidatus Nitrospira neomarina TaxID=3020899 RepID=A0AA96GJ52_9BACT|nr:DUF423 domain-containing protein [Candidatus Nitrospira neomarina]WNM63399.1 DUF423 domain-containing protein [Candidatus Nitrospira neomarina]
MARQILLSGALMAFLGVAIGAFGAHGLKPFLSEQMLGVFETGVRYHLIHALGMLSAGLSLVYVPLRQFRWAGWAFSLGIVLFSGSLYVMSLSGVRGLGMITPFGGLCFLVGWGLLARGYWKAFPSPNTPSSPPESKESMP